MVTFNFKSPKTIGGEKQVKLAKPVIQLNIYGEFIKE